MRAPRPAALTAALLALAAAPLGAQPPAAPGTVTGAVYDSLARMPLAGAEVQIVLADGGGRAFSVTTDAEGRYRVDSVPAGRYLAGFLHPRVDSLGLGFAPVAVELRGDTTRVDLAFPSAASVQRQLCGAAEISDSTALLVGFVRDAATRTPRRDATVRLRWTELVIGASGVRHERPEIVVRTRGDGWYGVCGVPRTDRDDIAIVAESGADTSGLVPLRVGAAGVVRRDVYVGRAAAMPALRRGGARISGVVYAAGGRPVVGARVRLLGGAGVATTDHAGAFTLVGQPAGSQLLDVRAVGYVPVQLAVDLLESAGGAPNAVAVTLPSVKSYLDTIRVTANRVDPTGFERRRRTSPTGHFMDREAIARRHAFRTAYLFSGVPGVRVDFDALGEPELLMRSGTDACRPMVYLDRMPLGSSELELFTWPDKLQGVEVYRDAAFTPAEFNRGGGCGSIVLWTRPPEPKPRRAGRATR